MAGQIDLLEGDITHLERFGAAEFSFVVCVGGAISHALESGPQAVRELVRVAQPSMPELLGGGTPSCVLPGKFRPAENHCFVWSG